MSRKARIGGAGLALALGMGACGQPPAIPENSPEPAAARVNALLGIRSTVSACAVTDRLIPSCGAWWGVAPEIFTGRRPGRALARAERRMGRPADIMHVYHRGSELFPTPEERKIARDPAGRRLLLVNWKPSSDRTWAEIAGGAIDRRIDRLADHVRRSFPERFFLTVHHEPENDVLGYPGSGMTAEDYSAMFRHVVLRLRQRGVRNVVTVMTYMGAPSWAAEPWFERLYPGDDVVDWVAMDPYADDRVRTFDGLVNKTRVEFAGWPGFYRWMQSRFPTKPIMIAEWGVFERRDDPGFKEAFFSSVRREMRLYPQIKALVYFDSPRAPRGDTRFDTTAGGLRTFEDLARDPYLRATAVPDQ
ncbi:glycoside hydrolase family 26 protein [Streptosporangium sp. NPDC087985]|uniref:glycoside hydrolase family 26 protein n=1 Tax=Streptosporangium sp. NPDC087985 TaxID=3366196 RepID=UPI0037FA0CB0